MNGSGVDSLRYRDFLSFSTSGVSVGSTTATGGISFHLSPHTLAMQNYPQEFRMKYSVETDICGTATENCTDSMQTFENPTFFLIVY